MEYHKPVLLDETISSLCVRKGGIYVDATFGGGGHARLLLHNIGSNGYLYAFDQDEEAAENAAAEVFAGQDSFRFVGANFRYIKRMLRLEGVKPGAVHGIMADLGVSSHQFDTAERGFSYRFEAALDMRMNSAGDHQSAADVLNTYTETELVRVFSDYGEVRNSKTLAKAIVLKRTTNPFRNISDLMEVLNSNIMGERMRYLSQVFQALRIEVNDEMGALAEFLQDSLEMLRVGGRLSVITYHSLEDRMVKNFLKTGNIKGEPVKDFYGNIHRPFDIITKKAMEPSADEIKINPRARSAKLRVGEKI